MSEHATVSGFLGIKVSNLKNNSLFLPFEGKITIFFCKINNLNFLKEIHLKFAGVTKILLFYQ